MEERMDSVERPEKGRRKQALSLIGKHGEVNSAGDETVRSGKGLESFLDVMALILPGLGLRN